MRGAAVLRPQPGNAQTVARLAAQGVDVLAVPLFAVVPLAWKLPDLSRYDALLLTSANAVRHGGPGLATVRHLPVIAVGATTAAVASRAGFKIWVAGDHDATAALEAAGPCRPLHLAGRDRRDVGADAVSVYASEALVPESGALAAMAGRIALAHSPRAAARLASLIRGTDRAKIGLAALSPAVLAAAGEGWGWAAAAAVPQDETLVELVVKRLTGSPPPRISGA